MRSTHLGTIVFALIALLAAWRLWRSPYDASNLEIVPDSVEYVVAADRVVTHQGYNLLIDGVARPPRYPPWFSVGFLAPMLFFAQGQLGAAILPVFFFGIASVVAACAIGKSLSGLWGAAGAGLALLFSPTFATLSRVVMTDVPSLAFGLAACWLYVKAPARLTQPRDTADTDRSDVALPAGLLAAAGFALRSECLAILLPFAWRIVRSERRPLVSLGRLVMPSLAVFAATAWYNAATFGSWQRTGYNYWCPVPYDFLSLTFGLRYLSRNLEQLLTAPRIVALILSGIGAAVLLARNRAGARQALTYLALAALPGTLLHLVYFYPEARFHLFVLALACVIGGAGFGSLAERAVHGRLWPILLVIGLTALVPRFDSFTPPYRRMVADTLARETPPDAVIVSGLDPVFLEPYLLRGSSRTLVPASRSVEYASKLVAETRLGPIDPPPRGPTDHRAPGLFKAGAVDPCPIVATESRERLMSWLHEGRRVFVDASFFPGDAPIGRIFDPGIFFVPNPRVPWLAEVRLP